MAVPATTVGCMTGFAQQPGSEESLLALYDAVGAAEELDLEQQSQGDAAWDEPGALDDLQADDIVDPSDTEDIDDAERVTMAQAMGLIEHLLGGQPVADGGHSAR